MCYINVLILRERCLVYFFQTSPSDLCADLSRTGYCACATNMKLNFRESLQPDQLCSSHDRVWLPKASKLTHSNQHQTCSRPSQLTDAHAGSPLPPPLPNLLCNVIAVQSHLARRGGMYKYLLLTTFTALIAYYLATSTQVHSGVHRSVNQLKGVSFYSKMANQSVSRSIVKKVLAMEQSEVGCLFCR